MAKQEYFIDEPGYYLDENLTLMVERKLGKESDVCGG